jgi:lysophospholipase L1-like esterase
MMSSSFFRRVFVGAFAIASLSVAVFARQAAPAATAAQAQVADPDPKRFAAEIKAFDDWDRKNAAPAHGILFAGSSTIRMWPTGERFPNLPVINRGFGGSDISDVNFYIQETVLKYAPDVIVFYAGDNDINNGKAPERVLTDYRTFVTRVFAAKRDATIVFIAIKPSLARWKLWPVMQDANARVKTYSEGYSKSQPGKLMFVDMAPQMLGADGTPKKELFVGDGLHMTPAGYDIWTAALRPLLTKK